MKVIFKNSQYYNKLSKYKGQDISQNNNSVNMGKSVENKPAQAISFSGLKFPVDNKTFNNIMKYAIDNEVMYNTIFALVFAGILKPLLVLNMPGSEEKDKQLVATKNFTQAMVGTVLGMTIGGGFVNKLIVNIENNLKLLKFNGDELSTVEENSKEAIELAQTILKKQKNSFSNKFKSAKEISKNFSGLDKIKAFSSNLFKKVKVDFNDKETKQEVSNIASNCVKNLREKHLKFYQNNMSYTKKLINSMKTDVIEKGAKSSLHEAFRSCWKNSTGSPTTILKAKISSWLLPSVVAVIFANKKMEQKKQSNINKTTLLNSKNFQEEKNKFKAIISTQKEALPINFKGSILDKAVDIATQGVEKLSMSKVGEVPVKFLTKFKHPTSRMGDLESMILTSYWVNKTNKSKKIAPEQKLGLNTHSIIVSLIGSISAAFIDKLTDKPIENSKELFKTKLESIVDTIKNNKDITDYSSEIKKSCSNLFNPDLIAKKLVKDNKMLDGENLTNAINNLAKNYTKKLSKFKSLTLFTFTVRFLIPVLMVPISGKLKKKLVEIMSKKNKKNKINS